MSSITVFKADHSNEGAHDLPAADLAALRAAATALEGVSDERAVALRRQLLVALNPDGGVEKSESGLRVALRKGIQADSEFIDGRAAALRKDDANLGLADALAIAHREPDVKAAAERMRKLDEAAAVLRAAEEARPALVDRLRKAEAQSEVLSLSERADQLRKSEGLDDTQAYSRALNEQRLGLGA